MAYNFSVAGAAALANAIGAINVGGALAMAGAAYTITVTGTIDLSLDVPVIDLPPGATLTIVSSAANTFAIDGKGVARGFVIQSGQVTLQNLLLRNFVALGAAGGSGSSGGGGAGGLGGAVFVAAGAQATLDNIQFNGNSAVGGAGGAGTGAGSGGTGGQSEGSYGGSAGAGLGDNGGFGGGGAGAQAGGKAGEGGFGGGSGSAATAKQAGGGGGLGAGADVFVQSGGVLTLNGTDLSPGTIGGGAGADGATNGSAYGASVFYEGSGDIVVGASGADTSILGGLSDLAGSGAGGQAGSVRLVQEGGALSLLGSSDFTGGIAFEDGSIDLYTSQAAGTGPIEGSGGGSLITIEAGVHPQNVFEDLLGGTIIDVRGIGSATDVVEAGGVLTVTTPTQTFTLNLITLPGGVSWNGDGDGGTDLVINAHPQKYVVTTGADDVSGAAVAGHMTLREAVTLADGGAGGTIVFAAGITAVTLQGRLEISGAVMIEGGFVDGAPAVTIHGSDGDGALLIDAAATVTLSGVQVTGGSLIGSAGAQGAAGAAGADGAQAVEKGHNDVVPAGTGGRGSDGMDGGNGGDALGAGIANYGTLTLVDSLVTGNVALAGDGGNGGAGGHGGAGGRGSPQDDNVLSLNPATSGGDGGDSGLPGLGGQGGDAVGGVYSPGSLTLTDSTIAGNTQAGGSSGVAGALGTPGAGGMGGERHDQAGTYAPSGASGVQSTDDADSRPVQPGIGFDDILYTDVGQHSATLGSDLLDIPATILIAPDPSHVAGPSLVEFDITNESATQVAGFSLSSDAPGDFGTSQEFFTRGVFQTGDGQYQLLPGQTGAFYANVFDEAGSGFPDITVVDGADTARIPVDTAEAAACYCAGTLILTDCGERPVEALAAGDFAVTLSGDTLPIRWIGRRSYAGRFVAGNHLMLPVCVKAGALADGVPTRDLHVSPGHALFVDEQLVPAWRLVNGVSIVQAAAVASVTYYHVELDRHAVILAEGAAAESFVDDACRGQFHNADEFHRRYPEAPRMTPLQPRLEDGFGLRALQERMAARAGWVAPVEPIGALRGFVDVATPERVTGWAQDADSPDEPVALEVSVAGCPVMCVLANAFRADLRVAGFGSGCHGFDAALPVGLAGIVMIRRVTDGSALVFTGAARALGGRWAA